MNKFVKDAEAVLDYPWDWADYLQDNETISAFDVVIAGGSLVVDSFAQTAPTVITAWLSAGTPGRGNYIDCQIETSMGRSDSRSIYVMVSDR